EHGDEGDDVDALADEVHLAASDDFELAHGEFDAVVADDAVGDGELEGFDAAADAAGGAVAGGFEQPTDEVGGFELHGAEIDGDGSVEERGIAVKGEREVGGAERGGFVLRGFLDAREDGDDGFKDAGAEIGRDAAQLDGDGAGRVQSARLDGAGELRGGELGRGLGEDGAAFAREVVGGGFDARGGAEQIDEQALRVGQRIEHGGGGGAGDARVEARSAQRESAGGVREFAEAAG